MAFPNPSIGPIGVGGLTVLDLASMEGPMTDAAEDVSTYLNGRRRSRRKGLPWYKLSWSWTFVGTADKWAELVGLLEGDAAGEFQFAPRGQDTFVCRCTSDLKRLTPLYLNDAKTGLPLYVVDVVVECVFLVNERPDVYLPIAALNTLEDADLDTLTDEDGATLFG